MPSCGANFDLLETLPQSSFVRDEESLDCGTFFFPFLQLPFLSSRAVQLGSLYVRGLSHLLGANCASGGPLPNAALMPWHSFDGRLFHSKYLLAHSGVEKAVLLESDVSVNRLTIKESWCAAFFLNSDLLCGFNAREFSSYSFLSSRLCPCFSV